MIWNLEIVKAKHILYTDPPVLGYLDQKYNVVVPMLEVTLQAKHLANMEEFSQTDQGTVYIDISTGRIGIRT